MKVKCVNDLNRADVDKLCRQEKFYVDFIAKETDGLTSTFIAPYVVTNDDYNISMVTANPGQVAQSLM